MTTFSVLMVLPERNSEESSTLVSLIENKMRNNIRGLIKQEHSSSYKVNSAHNNYNCESVEYNYTIEGSENDSVKIILVKSCQDAHSEMQGRKLKNLNCIVIDFEENCFVDTFYQKIKEDIRQKKYLLFF